MSKLFEKLIIYIYMIEPIEWLRIFINDHRSFEYLIIFFGAAFGGELALFTLGFLAAQNVVSTLPVVILGFLGALLPNILWFFLGKTAAVIRIVSHRYANGTILTVTEAVRRASQENHLTAFIMIKFLVGTPLILIMYINQVKFGFRRFIYYESVAILLSLALIGSIGFASGLGFTYFSEIVENLYAAIGFLLLIVIIIISAQIWFEKRFTKTSK